MKYLLLILMCFVASFSQAQNCTTDLVNDDYSEYARVIDEENAKPYLPAGAWYWDPTKPGVGLSVTVQESKNGSSGVFVFGAFYTYKSDGSQAWYTIAGDYEPNDNVNDWREDLEKFGTSVADTSVPSQTRELVGFSGCFYGNSDTWMGELNAPLYETSDGPVLDGEWSQMAVSEYKQAKLVWLSPDQIEIYLDGSSTPAHLFERQNLHGDLTLGDADYILHNTYHMDMLHYGILPNVISPSGDRRLYSVRYQGNLNFREFDPDIEFSNTPDWAVDDFVDFTELHSNKRYFISKRPLTDLISMDFNHVDESVLAFRNYDDSLFVNISFYVLIAYDLDYKLLELYLIQPNDADGDLTQGYNDQIDCFRFKTYLPPEDQGRLSFYPAACEQCGNNFQFRKEVIRRSSVHLYKLPELGDFFEQMPDVFSEGDNVTERAGE